MHIHVHRAYIYIGKTSYVRISDVEEFDGLE